MESCSKICEPCFEQNTSIKATKYCKICGESFCDSCSASHKAQKATRNHDLTEIEEIELQNVKSENCEPCSYNGNYIPATFQCKECRESYCDACARTHQSQKATRTHEVVPVVQNERTTCEACSYNGDENQPAAGKCTECDEVLCASCVKMHKSQKATRQHNVEAINNKSIFEKSPSTSATSKSDFKSYTADQDNLCDICKATGHLPDSATSFCFTCRKALCQSCLEDHKMTPSTNHHQILLVQQHSGNIDVPSTTELIVKTENESENITMHSDSVNLVLGCGSCHLADEAIEGFCVQCQIQLCKRCAEEHRKVSDTRGHVVLLQTKNETSEDEFQEAEKSKDERDIGDTAQNVEAGTLILEGCGLCNTSDEVIEGFCIQCKVQLCKVCADKHPRLKETKEHVVLVQTKHVEPAQILPKGDEKEIMSGCGLCEVSHEPDIAGFCVECKVQLCSSCLKAHSEFDATKDHHVFVETKQNDQVSAGVHNTFEDRQEEENNAEKSFVVNQMLPGKPEQASALKFDRVTITWNPPQFLLDSYAYQIRYRRTETSQWEYYEDKTTHTTSTIKGLKSHSTYVFQVRMVNNETEGPYSDMSDAIDTLPSAAELVMHLSVEDNQPGRPLQMRKFKLNECISARNQNIRTRKLILGDGTQYAGKEKTMLLLGASGTGKTTFTDAIVNFIFGTTFADQFRFTVVDYEKDETENEDKGKTRWVTCYTIFPTKGSMIDFKLTIIDTPGFGDKGIEEDELIKTQLKELFSAVDEKGVLFVDAVCIFMKASEARLTVTQQYIYTTITSLFHRDIEENICSVITFSDGKAPPVLSALREANLPFETYYPFNTTDMFSDNSQTLQNGLTKVFFELNLGSFGSLLEKVKHLKTKSLTQSKEVLEKRQQVEKTAEILLVKIDLGLVKMENCKKEIASFEQFKTEMIANSNFTYKTRKKIQNLIPLEKGKHTTNCLHCNTTCHDNCAYADDEDKAQCVAMRDGYCTVCEDKCFWRKHKNTPFIIEWKEVEENCVYAEIKEKFEKAKGEMLSHEALVNTMKEELDDIEEDMLNIMHEIAECNNELSRMALRANPLSVSEHIDIIIENEKWVRKPGFQDRISNLEKLKRRVAIDQGFEQFRKSKEGIIAHK